MLNTKLFIALSALGFAGSAFATNGMNLEGYGPIALGMGGASMAYDNGNAAMMNNPATLGLMPSGSRLDLALGMLGPDVNVVGMQSSGGDSYIMPAVGWTKKDGKLTYGVGLFAQGGMGTEYATQIMGLDALPERSELGVGRLMAPIAFNVNDKLTIGGSIDYVWAMLDIRMALPGAMLGAPGAANSLITNAGSSGALGAMATGGAFAGLTSARLDFSDRSDYTGKAKGTGFAGKLGFTFKASPMVTIGGTYHFKTSLSDLETGASSTVFTPNGFGMIPETGKITVRDFQWPETYGLGIAVQATPSLMIAADVKKINWSDVMDSFKMTYTSGGGNGLGGSVGFELPQNWDDQTVFQIGVSYKVNDALTLRAGANISDNPIPSTTVHYLFPAIEENHYTLGLGYAFSKASDINFTMSYAPKVSQTNTGAAAGMIIEHSQLSWQFMYSTRF